MQEWMEVHRMGKCGEEKCRLDYTTEMSLGLPEDPYERQAWYDKQKETYAEWDKNTAMRHQWHWAVGKCHHCEATETVGISADKKLLCATWCLNTAARLYPTGIARGHLYHYAIHSQNCTSHSWSETLESMPNLNEMLSQWQHTMSQIRSSYTSSSSAKTKKSRKSSNAGRSQNSALPNLKLPGFNIPKKSS